ncbi:hypothetical protein CHUAL_003937 [Chamberlinius hualienensis]
MNEDLDSHVCLRCTRLFTSLENYVHHRKASCTPVNQPLTAADACKTESNNVEISDSINRLDCDHHQSKEANEIPVERKMKGVNAEKRRTRYSVKSQRLNQSSKEISEFCCKLCILKFSCQVDLVEHLNSNEHWKRRNVDDEAHVQMILSNSHLLAAYSPFKCAICSFYFNRHVDLIQHWSSQIEAHARCRKKNLKFNCSACRNVFQTPEEVFSHLFGNSQHLESIKQMRVDRKSVIITTTNFHCCTKCSWKGKTKSDLKLHHENRHLPTAKLKVDPEINDEINDETLREDEEKPKRKYTKSCICTHCKLTLSNGNSLSEHIRARHPEKLFHCVICSVDFETESFYAKHMHSRMHKQCAAGLTAMGEISNSSETPTHACDHCEFETISKSALLFHQAIHKGQVEVCKSKEIEKKRGKMYRCPICGEITKLGDLRSHLVSHTDEKPFICQFCNECFSAKGTLASHIRSKHSEKKFVCTECSFRTHRKDKLAAHEETHHKEQRIRSFLCETCGTGFFNRSTLKHHTRLHLPVELGGKTQICSFPGCRLSFRSPSELVIHMRTHTGERPFLCGTCRYSAKTKHQLTKHERSHFDLRPFKCSHCSYSTSLSYHLLRHMRIHTGAKPFSCPHCDYTCNTHENLPGDLKTHMFNSHSDVVDLATHTDSAFSSLITGIFSRQDDIKTIDHPSTPYIPRTEKPGYREKMKQSRRTKINMKTEEIIVLNSCEIEEIVQDNITETIEENVMETSDEVDYLSMEIVCETDY